MQLSKRIKEKRLEAKLTQEKLGSLLHVSKVSVSNWESGLKKPSSKNLIQLSKILNTPLEYLIGNDYYVISSDDEKYGIMMSKEEIEIIKELKNHKKLYEMLNDNPKRILDRIDKNLF